MGYGYKTAVDVYKALNVLSEVLGIDFQQVAARVCLFEEEKAEILKEASNKWNAFSDADVVERGVMLGVDISEPCEESKKDKPATDLGGRVNGLVMRPGSGWKRVAGAVYDREDGLRVHMLGLCRLPDGTVNQADSAEESYMQGKLIRINGGNRKRGMMAWAATVAARSA